MRKRGKILGREKLFWDNCKVELSIPGVGEAPGSVPSAGTPQVTSGELENQQHQELRLFGGPETPAEVLGALKGCCLDQTPCRSS